MVSFGTIDAVQESRYISTTIIQEQNYYQERSLLLEPNQVSKFMQIYFMGNTDVKTDQWQTNLINIDFEIVAALQQMLHEKITFSMKTISQIINGFRTDAKQ